MNYRLNTEARLGRQTKDKIGRNKAVAWEVTHPERENGLAPSLVWMEALKLLILVTKMLACDLVSAVMCDTQPKAEVVAGSHACWKKWKFSSSGKMLSTPRYIPYLHF